MKTDLETSLIVFLNSIKPSKKDRALLIARNALIRYFGKDDTTTTCEDLLKWKHGSILRVRDLGEKAYIHLCDELKKHFEYSKWSVFEGYESVKKHLNRKHVELTKYSKKRRKKALKSLIKKLKEKSTGYVSDEQKFSELLDQLKGLIS